MQKHTRREMLLDQRTQNCIVSYRYFGDGTFTCLLIYSRQKGLVPVDRFIQQPLGKEASWKYRETQNQALLQVVSVEIKTERETRNLLCSLEKFLVKILSGDALLFRCHKAHATYNQDELYYLAHHPPCLEKQSQSRETAKATATALSERVNGRFTFKSSICKRASQFRYCLKGAKKDILFLLTTGRGAALESAVPNRITYCPASVKIYIVRVQHRLGSVVIFLH